MLDISSIQSSAEQDLQAVEGLVNSLYEHNFSEYFKGSREIFSRLDSNSHPITDEELNWILIDLPVKLFDVSEKLSQFKMKHETLKLILKKKESDITSELKDNGAKAGDIKIEVANATIEDKLLINAYASVIGRVESEVAFSKELIMSGKKIWTARRETDASNPVSEIPEELPDYKIDGKTYIKGA
jgi:hypothetical protein